MRPSLLRLLGETNPSPSTDPDTEKDTHIMAKKPASTEQTAVTGPPQQESQVPAVAEDQLPAYLQGGSGYENEDNFGSDDVVLPRIKLLQGISPEITEYPDAHVGHFWHTGLDMDLGPEIRFIIADRRRKYLLQAPIADGQGILARSDDATTWDRTGSWQVKLKGVKQPVTWAIDDLDVAKSGVAAWGSSNPDDEDSPPAATLFYDYLVYLPDYPDLGMSIMSLARAAIRKARKGLNDKVKMHLDRGRPLQSLVFRATSVEETSPDGGFKNWHFMSGGFVQDESLFLSLREYAGALARLRAMDEDKVAEENDITPAPAESDKF